MKLSTNYEDEQHTLETRVSELQRLITTEKDKCANVDSFLKIVRKYADIEELTPEIIREFVEKIYVYNAERIDGKRVQKIKIVWNCIGDFCVPMKD